MLFCTCVVFVLPCVVLALSRFALVSSLVVLGWTHVVLCCNCVISCCVMLCSCCHVLCGVMSRCYLCSFLDYIPLRCVEVLIQILKALIQSLYFNERKHIK